MRVSLRELKGVTQGGMLVRYAVLGETAFALVELPESGTAGTSLEQDCQQEHWGLILGGDVSLEGPSPRAFTPGTAFHIAPGGQPHRFHADGRAVIAGFVPLAEPVDESPDALRARGLEIAKRMPVPQAPPSLMKVSGTLSRVEKRGAIELETAQMGAWMFTRTTFGPYSGYTSGWCDLPHWGLVLSGDVVLNHENEVELLTAGDVFLCPAGPPGHQFEVADQATIIDYTPIAEMDRGGRQEAWRTTHRRRQSRAPAGSDERLAGSQPDTDAADSNAERTQGRVTSLLPRTLEPLVRS
jgi:hypothetical protein